MSNKFDELAKGLAQSVTRRQALKQFALGLSGVVLASLGVANTAKADSTCLPLYNPCASDNQCCSGICRLLVSKKWGGQKICYYV